MSKTATRTRVDGPLDEVNDGFHDAYDRARTSACDEAPVLVLLGDSIVRLHCGERAEFELTPRVFHLLKSAAHAPLALFVALHGQGEQGPDRAVRRKLDGLRAHVGRALERAHEVDEPAAREDLRTTLEKTASGLDRALSDEGLGPEALGHFARELGPLLLRLTEHATRAQLGALERCVDRALEGLDEDARAALQVVVAGDHQARERSLGMQYFRKRLGESGEQDERVTYAENVSTEDEARALIGTRRLDRAVAGAFFGDPRRLQRDVLGDAAKHLLDSVALGSTTALRREPAPR